MESLPNLKTDQESKLNNFSPNPSPPTFVFEIYNLSYRFIKLNAAIAQGGGGYSNFFPHT